MWSSKLKKCATIFSLMFYLLASLFMDAISKTVFAEMSSWTVLTLFTVMKTAFKTNNMKREFFGIFMMKISKFKSG